MRERSPSLPPPASWQRSQQPGGRQPGPQGTTTTATTQGPPSADHRQAMRPRCAAQAPPLPTSARTPAETPGRAPTTPRPDRPAQHRGSGSPGTAQDLGAHPAGQSCNGWRQELARDRPGRGAGELVSHRAPDAEVCAKSKFARRLQQRALADPRCPLDEQPRFPPPRRRPQSRAQAQRAPHPVATASGSSGDPDHSDPMRKAQCVMYASYQTRCTTDGGPQAVQVPNRDPCRRVPNASWTCAGTRLQRRYSSSHAVVTATSRRALPSAEQARRESDRYADQAWRDCGQAARSTSQTFPTWRQRTSRA